MLGMNQRDDAMMLIGHRKLTPTILPVFKTLKRAHRKNFRYYKWQCPCHTWFPWAFEALKAKNPQAFCFFHYQVPSSIEWHSWTEHVRYVILGITWERYESRFTGIQAHDECDLTLSSLANLQVVSTFTFFDLFLCYMFSPFLSRDRTGETSSHVAIRTIFQISEVKFSSNRNLTHPLDWKCL